MRLADELRGVGVKKPFRQGMRRVLYCVGEGSAPDVLAEERNRKARERAKAWRLKNPDRVKAAKARDSAKRREAIAASKKRWRENNIAHVRAYQARKMREWRREHREGARATKRRWYEKHRGEILARRRAKYAAKRAAAQPLREAA